MTVSGSLHAWPAALRTTLQYRGYIQTAVAAEFVSYSVQAYAESLPTPSSGATTGADYYISVSSALSQPFSFAAINSFPKWSPPSYSVSLCMRSVTSLFLSKGGDRYGSEH